MSWERLDGETWKRYAKRCERSRGYWMSTALGCASEVHDLRRQLREANAYEESVSAALRQKVRELQLKLAEIRGIADVD